MAATDHSDARKASHVDVSSDDGEGLLNHKRLCHFSANRLHASGANGKHDVLDCPACCLNTKRAPISRKSATVQGKAKKYSKFGQKVNVDLLMMPDSIEGYKYSLSTKCQQAR